jgi:hypothetical protein
MAVGVYSLAYEFSEGPTSAPLSPSFLHANDVDLGLFPGKQYIFLVGLVKRKS